MNLTIEHRDNTTEVYDEDGDLVFSLPLAKTACTSGTMMVLVSEVATIRADAFKAGMLAGREALAADLRKLLNVSETPLDLR